MSTSRKDKRDVVQLHHEFRTIVGAIIILAQPLSRTALAALLDIAAGDIQICLRSLHAVLFVPPNGKDPIRPLHLSFGEYLISQEARDTPYWIDTVATHVSLWKQCLELMCGSTGLRENICHLKHPGQTLSEVPSMCIEQCLPPELQYACRYWTLHIQASTYRVCDGDEVHIFLQQHFLHWLEALSCMKQLAHAVRAVASLQSLTSGSESSGVGAFLEDARRFILAFEFIGEQAPLQLYSSAIMFTPQTSMIRNVCGRLPAWIQQGPVTPPTWGPELQKLEGHTSSVIAVAFSPDGSLLASASYDKTIRLWDVGTGQETLMLGGHTERVHKVAFSGDGRLLASAASDETVRIWDVRTGRKVHQLDVHADKVDVVSFSPRSSSLLIILSSSDGTTRILDAETGQETQTLTGHTRAVIAVFFPDDGGLISVSSDCTVKLQTTITSQEIKPLRGSHWTRHTAISPDNSTIALALKSNLLLWNIKTDQKLELAGRYSANAVAFSPRSPMLATAGADETIKLWNTETGQEIQTLCGHTSAVDAVALSPCGSLLASGSSDGTVRLWDVKTRPETEIETDREVHTGKNYGYGGHTLVLSHNGSLLASPQDGIVQLWDTKMGQEIQRLDRQSDTSRTVVFSPSGALLASIRDRTIRIWDTETGREIRTLKGQAGKITAMIFSPCGSFLASGSGGRRAPGRGIHVRYASPPTESIVQIWDMRTGQEIQALREDINPVHAMVFSPCGLLLASGSTNGTVRVWNMKRGEEVQRLNETTNPIDAILFSPDSSLVAFGSCERGDFMDPEKSTICLWDLKTGRALHNFKGHTGLVFAIAFSRDSSVLASTSYNKVRLWDVKTGQMLQSMDDVGYLHYLKFLPDDHTLLTSRGYIETNLSSTLSLSPTHVSCHGLRLHGEWITCWGQKLLWLPQEYRTDFEAVFENMIAIGKRHGNVVILRIEWPPPSISPSSK